MIEKHGSARWKGSLKDGTGIVSTESGVLSEADYSFKKRFGGEPGTNPEELLGAAHAACFSMALSKALGDSGLTPDSIDTTSTVTLVAGEGITKVHLDVTARVPGATEDQFMAAATGAKSGCPVSKLFNAEITMDARLG